MNKLEGNCPLFVSIISCDYPFIHAKKIKLIWCDLCFFLLFSDPEINDRKRLSDGMKPITEKRIKCEGKLNAIGYDMSI
jgi:hypothetical protein